jgi:hypothetical protein
VVPAVGDEPYAEGWVSPLNAAIYPAEADRRHQQAATGCPPFQSRDSVLRRPGGDPASRSTVCPGAHSIGSPEGHSLVWWSPEPQVLTLGVQAPFGLRRDDLLVRDVAPDILRQRLDAHAEWQSSRSAIVAAAGQPSIHVETATSAAAERDATGAAGVLVTKAHTDGQSRPGGARFGSLVHALLADVPLGREDGEALERLADAHGRILGATRDEITAATSAVIGALAHPVLQAARSADREGQCYRETAVTLRLDSGAMVEGVVDLAYRDAEGFVVVDFKTDRELDGALEEYERQISLYATAIGRSTGLPTRAVLMRV